MVNQLCSKGAKVMSEVYRFLIVVCDIPVDSHNSVLLSISFLLIQ